MPFTHVGSYSEGFNMSRQRHGMTGTPLHNIWLGMIERCTPTTKKERYIKGYIKRGITVCPTWRKSFLSFYKWAIKNGYQKDLELDRSNNDGNYSPRNCRWITHKENMQNSRCAKLTQKLANEAKSYREQDVPQYLVAKFLGVIPGTIRNIERGLSWA